MRTRSRHAVRTVDFQPLRRRQERDRRAICPTVMVDVMPSLSEPGVLHALEADSAHAKYAILPARKPRNSDGSIFR